MKAGVPSQLCKVSSALESYFETVKSVILAWLSLEQYKMLSSFTSQWMKLFQCMYSIALKTSLNMTLAAIVTLSISSVDLDPSKLFTWSTIS